MAKMIIKRENWKGRYVFVARKNGRLQSWRNVKGSRLTISSAKSLYRENLTFSRKIKRQKTKLTNVSETIITKATTINQRFKRPIRNPHKKAMYQVSGYYNGGLISARSQKLGSPLAKTPADAKERAWTSFLERLNQVATGGYDADEGIKEISKVRNLREGWVYYE